MNTYLAWMFALVLLVTGCGSKDQPPRPAPAEAPRAEAESTPPASTEAMAPEASAQPEAAPPAAAAEAPAEVPVEREPAQTPAAEVEPVAGAQPVIEPTPTAEPAPATSPAVEASQPDVVDPGGMIEVAATKPGLTRIGADKCKMCHKVQFESWSTTPHAQRTPPLDCESCHGAGSEYKAMAIMKDPAQAAAAGLVTPDRAFCEQCHVRGWNEEFLVRAHAHKP